MPQIVGTVVADGVLVPETTQKSVNGNQEFKIELTKLPFSTIPTVPIRPNIDVLKSCIDKHKNVQKNTTFVNDEKKSNLFDSNSSQPLHPNGRLPPARPYTSNKDVEKIDSKPSKHENPLNKTFTQNPKNSTLVMEDVLLGCFLFESPKSEAEKRHKETMSWRSATGVDNLMKIPYNDFHAIKELYPSEIGKKTKTGGHIWSVKVGQLSFQSLKNSPFTLADLAKYEIFICEYFYNFLDAGGDGGALSILDLKGLKIREFISNVARNRKIIQYFNNVISNHYPKKGMNKTVIVNTPRTFNLLWKLISPMIDKKLKENLIIVRSRKDMQKVLLELVDEQNLSIEYGGKDMTAFSQSDSHLKLLRFINLLNSVPPLPPRPINLKKKVMKILEANVEKEPIQDQSLRQHVKEEPMKDQTLKEQVEEKPLQDQTLKEQVEEKPLQDQALKEQVEEEPIQDQSFRENIAKEPKKNQPLKGHVEKNTTDIQTVDIPNTENSKRHAGFTNDKKNKWATAKIWWKQRKKKLQTSK